MCLSIEWRKVLHILTLLQQRYNYIPISFQNLAISWYSIWSFNILDHRYSQVTDTCMCFRMIGEELRSFLSKWRLESGRKLGRWQSLEAVFLQKCYLASCKTPMPNDLWMTILSWIWWKDWLCCIQPRNVLKPKEAGESLLLHLGADSAASFLPLLSPGLSFFFFLLGETVGEGRTSWILYCIILAGCQCLTTFPARQTLIQN